MHKQQAPMDLREQYAIRYARIGKSLEQIFGSSTQMRRYALLVDVPPAADQDTEQWRDRRAIATEWMREAHLAMLLGLTQDSFELLAYEAVGSANADLLHPARCIRVASDAIPATASELAQYDAPAMDFEELYANYDCLVALTQYSATAPLKMAAKKHGFKAATMPGFTRAMISALGVDLDEVERRCVHYANLLTKAEHATISFAVHGVHAAILHMDLRHRTAVASTGRLQHPGSAGNLPSGEAFIVPYEGEIAGDKSQTQGILPIELDGEILYCCVEQNQVVRVRILSLGQEFDSAAFLHEPALGNVAELGLGVLAQLGIQPVGSVLLDEKLAPHIAFGRSEHLGGVTSPKAFKDPKNVSHDDFVFHPKMMPNVCIESIVLQIDKEELCIYKDGAYV